MAVSHFRARTTYNVEAIGSQRGSEVGFQVGDEVSHGMHVGTVTDVGTVLIQMTTNEGIPRVACPWELVRIGAAKEGPGRTRGGVGSQRRQRRR